MIPQFDIQTGNLPPGEHEATWEEFVDRFGWNVRRRQLLDGIAESLDLFAAAGCGRVWLNGSFVTTKEEPGDFDAVWDPDDVDFDISIRFLGPWEWRKEDGFRMSGSEASGFRTFLRETRKDVLLDFSNTIETTWPKESLSLGSKIGAANDYQRVSISQHQIDPW